MCRPTYPRIPITQHIPGSKKKTQHIPIRIGHVSHAYAYPCSGDRKNWWRSKSYRKITPDVMITQAYIHCHAHQNAALWKLDFGRWNLGNSGEENRKHNDRRLVHRIYCRSTETSLSLHRVPFPSVLRYQSSARTIKILRCLTLHCFMLILPSL